MCLVTKKLVKLTKYASDELKSKYQTILISSLARATVISTTFSSINSVAGSKKTTAIGAKYIKELLHRTRMLGAKPAPSPCPASSKLPKFDGESLPDSTEYRQVVGALPIAHLLGPTLPMQSINYANICTLLPPHIGLLPSVSYATSNIPLIMDCCLHQEIFIFKPTVTLTGQGIPMIVDQPLVLGSILAIV